MLLICCSLLFFGPQQTGPDAVRAALHPVATRVLGEPLIRPKCPRYCLTSGDKLVARSSRRARLFFLACTLTCLQDLGQMVSPPVSCKTGTFQLCLHKSVLNAEQGWIFLADVYRYRILSYNKCTESHNPRCGSEKATHLLHRFFLCHLGLFALMSLHLFIANVFNNGHLLRVCTPIFWDLAASKASASVQNFIHCNKRFISLKPP